MLTEPLNPMLPQAESAHMPRVAYFPDSFHEVNGVAHTSRHFEAFARRRSRRGGVRRGDRRPQSVVWDEAENRLHTQKALMEFLLLGKVT